MAQSLFLLSINVQQLEAKKHELKEENFSIVNQTVQQINAYVRKAIANLRYPPAQDVLPWSEVLQNFSMDFEMDTGIKLQVDWNLSDDRLTLKEKIELKSNLREALLNIRKHANADQVWIYTEETSEGWLCSIVDNGQGYLEDPLLKANCFGLKIMKERSEKMDWYMQIVRERNQTKIIFGKKEIV
jgi:two-component system nitrate/nitrite sensor histidine kinase NarQ